MFLKLAHTEKEIFQTTKTLVVEINKIVKTFPPEERFVLSQQIRRAALSIHLNIAEGCSRKSLLERKRYFEIARGSVIEVDTAIGIAHDLSYINPEDAKPAGELIISAFKQLSGLIGT